MEIRTENSDYPIFDRRFYLAPTLTVQSSSTEGQKYKVTALASHGVPVEHKFSQILYGYLT